MAIISISSYNSQDGAVKEEIRCRKFQRIVKTWISCLGSFSLSITGGLILVWWELNYHRTNRQQWMVPLGLILFITPLMVWLALFISDFCNITTSQPCVDSTWILRHTTPEKPLHNDPER